MQGVVQGTAKGVLEGISFVAFEQDRRRPPTMNANSSTQQPSGMCSQMTLQFWQPVLAATSHGTTYNGPQACGPAQCQFPRQQGKHHACMLPADCRAAARSAAAAIASAAAATRFSVIANGGSTVAAASAASAAAASAAALEAVTASCTQLPAGVQTLYPTLHR